MWGVIWVLLIIFCASPIVVAEFLLRKPDVRGEAE